MLEAFKELIRVELRSIREVVSLNAEHGKEIRKLETARLDAIRRVDIANQSVTAERSHAAILALERTTLASAETLRGVVENSAKQLAAQTASAMQTVDQRIAALEKASYEGKGKESQTDPALARLTEAVESLTSSRATIAGAKGGILAGREWILAIVGLAGGCAGLLVTAVTIIAAVVAYVK